MRSLPRRALLSVLATAVVVLTPGAASARSWHAKDSKDDVVEIAGCVGDASRVASSFVCRSDPSPYTTGVSHPTADLLRLGVTYRTRSLTLTGRLADTPPHADDGLGWLVETKAPDGLLVAVSWRGGGAHLTLTTLAGQPVTCRGASVRTQPDRGWFKATLPAGCVHRSPWVKVGMRTQSRDHGNCYIDDALEAEFDPFLRSGFAFGPKVRRG